MYTLLRLSLLCLLWHSYFDYNHHHNSHHHTAYAFNVGTNVKMRVMHRGPSGSMFGYDVALYKDKREEYNLLVGAPRAHSGQPNVKRGGRVFKCSSRASRCSEVIFDRQGDTERLHGSHSMVIDSKSDQWFGATVVTSNDERGDAVLACAPRYLYFGSTFDRKEPVGNCFLATDSFNVIREFSPCKVDHKHGYHRFGYCMAGFSAALGNNEIAYISAPGAYYWGGMLIAQPTTQDNRRPLYTVNGSKEYDDQFLGYTTAVGDFNGDQIDDAIVGIPRGNHLTGMVALYTEKLGNILNISGDQLGSYFGSSVAVTDLNNDGLDDIIVGAPLYTTLEKTSAGVKSTYEVGKVYVYFQDKRHSFDKSAEVVGHKEWGRFGFEVAAAGDLNQDGYNDFIVGAPFDGDEKRTGAVYVYNGAKDGIHEKYSQVIYGQLIESGLQSFGFSLAGGRDVDGNGYPDILVGSYKSDVATLFKSRPVVNVKGYIRLSPDTIKLDDKKCTKNFTTPRRGGPPSEKVACTKLAVCVVYTGKGLSPSLDIKLVVSLDAGNVHETRANFMQRGSPSVFTTEVELNKENEFCDHYTIFVEEGIRDKLSPIMIHANYSVIEERYRGDSLVPVVDALDGGSFLKGELKIWKDCGHDDQCIPDLQIVSPTVNKEVIPVGADEHFNLSFVVKNRLEYAYEAYLYLFTPKGFDFEKATDKKNRTVSCSRQVKATEKELLNYEYVKCDLGNPMPGRNAFWNLDVQYATKFFEGPYDNVPIYILVNSTNNETDKTLDDNEKTVIMTFSLDADLTVFASSHNDSYIYDIDGYKDPQLIQWDDEIGPPVNHTYEIVNTGNSTFTEVQIDIYFPSHTHDGQPLLYIIDNITLGDNYHQTTCSLFQKGNINPNHYGISKKVRLREQLRRRKRRETRSAAPNLEETQPKSFLHMLSHLKDKTAGFLKLRSLMSQNRFNCYEMNCTQWRCITKDMRKGFRLQITVEARLWTNTMIREGFYGASISSVIIAQATKLPYKAPQGIDLPVKHAVATTAVIANDPSRLARGIPWWLILIAVLAGIALLILLILLLWRCGFFKRKRPPRGKALLAKPNEPEYYGYSTYSPANPNYPSHGQVPYGQRL